MPVNVERLTETTKPKPKPRNGEQLKQAQFAATEAASATKGALIATHQQQMQSLSNSLTRAEQKRDDVIQVTSDRIVRLQDGNLFMADLMREVQRKLQPSAEAQTTVDALVEAFDEIADWEHPAIAPSTVMGCLPL